MIGFPLTLIVDLVLAPQGEEERGETRAVLASEEAELGLAAQELDVLRVGSRPLPEGTQIGGSITIRHDVSVAVRVTHGDAAEAQRIRDAIVLELVLRPTSRDTRAAFLAVDDPANPPQTFDDLTWSVDYRPLGLDALNANAVVVFTLDTVLDR